MGSSTSGVQIADMSGMLKNISLFNCTKLVKEIYFLNSDLSSTWIHCFIDSLDEENKIFELFRDVHKKFDPLFSTYLEITNNGPQ